jgi:TPR repeat protein
MMTRLFKHIDGCANALTIIILFLSLVAPVAAGPFEDAAAAYDKGDYATALQLFQPLADEGFSPAQFIIGLMYEQGQGVTKNYSEAMRWFRKAADQGNSGAQLGLGAMFSKGEGVPKDNAEAAKWYRLAADQGVAMAQYNLAVRYYEGRGVPQDYVSAHMWFNLAAAQDFKDATKNRDLAAQHMTPAQIAEAQKLAGEWKSNNPKH